MRWQDLAYWDSQDWVTIQEKLNDLQHKGVLYNPPYDKLFASMDATPLENVSVVIVGQDPYPNHYMATGLAFSVPPSIERTRLPPTLKNIFKELAEDLHIWEPTNGDLTHWAKQGVFLWNAVPSCEAGLPGSHRWIEWESLTAEIIKTLDARSNCVFVLLGQYARSFAPLVVLSEVIETSHPSPLGAKYGFKGSRIFSTVNGLLVSHGRDPIDWRL